MGKYRNQQLFACPYCKNAVWFRRGQRDAHVRKSHPNEKPVIGTGIDEMFERKGFTIKKKGKK